MAAEAAAKKVEVDKAERDRIAHNAEYGEILREQAAVLHEEDVVEERRQKENRKVRGRAADVREYGCSRILCVSGGAALR